MNLNIIFFNERLLSPLLLMFDRVFGWQFGLVASHRCESTYTTYSKKLVDPDSDPDYQQNLIISS